MQVSDVGPNVWTEGSICILAAQMVDADQMFGVPLLASLSDPACACVPVQLTNCSCHQPNMELLGLSAPKQ